MSKGLAKVRAAFKAHAPGTRPRDEVPHRVAGDAEAWGYPAGSWPGVDKGAWPPKAPMVPLGQRDDVVYLLDGLDQLRDVKVDKFGNKVLLQLCGEQPEWLKHHFPRWSEPKKDRPAQINGIDSNDAIEFIFRETARLGIFDPNKAARGRGMWARKNRSIVWHAGDSLWTLTKDGLHSSRCGAIEGIVYPGAAALVAPSGEPTRDDPPGPEILDIVNGWNWERPALDPALLVGWIGCAFLGAALPWRPACFVTSDRGMGKSTLANLIEAVLGDIAERTANTTPAGIYQRIGRDARPVIVDELENKAHDQRAGAVIELARLAASGDEGFRGGADGQGTSFTMRSCFLFAAINPPAMTAADKSRIAFLNLRPLDASQTSSPSIIAADIMPGRMLRAVMEVWPRFDKAFEDWRTTLRGAGLDQRAQATYGTLLAMASLLLGDERMEAQGLQVTEPKAVGQLVADLTAAERAEQEPNWRRCVNHMLGTAIDAWKGGEKPTVGGAIEMLEKDLHHLDIVRSQLALVGLGIKRDDDEKLYLAVPVSRSPLLDKVFRESDWRDGVWANALRQGPGEVVRRDLGNGQNVKINRVTTRCLLVDLAKLE